MSVEEVNNNILKGNGYGGYKLQTVFNHLEQISKEEVASEIDVDSPAATANYSAERPNQLIQFTNPEKSSTSRIIWY
ncbi:hypothetical protein ACIQ34_11955 [Ureibacillus sp. NPDC094379]